MVDEMADMASRIVDTLGHRFLLKQLGLINNHAWQAVHHSTLSSLRMRGMVTHYPPYDLTQLGKEVLAEAHLRQQAEEADRG